MYGWNKLVLGICKRMPSCFQKYLLNIYFIRYVLCVFANAGKSIKLQYLVKDNAGVPKLGKL